MLLGFAAAPQHARAAFGVSDFVAEVRDQDGDASHAGRRATPTSASSNFTVNTTGGTPDGNVKDVRVDVPPGLISNPEATPKCTDVQYAASPARPRPSSAPRRSRAILPLPSRRRSRSRSTTWCRPPGASPTSRSASRCSPRAPTSSAAFAAAATTASSSRSSTSRRRRRSITSKLTFWGVPADPAHDAERGQSCTPMCLGGGSRAPPTRPVHHEPDVLRAAADDDADGRLAPEPGPEAQVHAT